jgi:uncharacterized protein YeaO (DUF488 family)
VWSPTREGELALHVQVKRVYDPSGPDDGFRVPIDDVWPRGVSRERARLDERARELARRDELRKWFTHVPARFDEFRARYRRELRAHADRIAQPRARACKGPLTILYAARDQEHNNTIVLAELLRDG